MSRGSATWTSPAPSAAMNPRLDMHRPTARPLGLTEESTYLYGGWRDESGALHIVERKFCGPMTAGYG
jgi:hypothetical protein